MRSAPRRGMAPPAEAGAEADGRRDQGARAGSVARRRACGARRHPIPLRRSGGGDARLREGDRAQPRAGRRRTTALGRALLLRSSATPRRCAAICKAASLDPLSMFIHTERRRRVLLRARVREVGRPLPDGDRARPAIRRRPHRPRALARGARPFDEARASTRRGAGWRAASRGRRSGSRTSRPPRRTTAEARRILAELTAARGAAGGLRMGHRGASREPRRRGRRLPVARHRDRRAGRRDDPAARAPAARSDPERPAVRPARPAGRAGEWREGASV